MATLGTLNHLEMKIEKLPSRAKQGQADQMGPNGAICHMVPNRATSYEDHCWSVFKIWVIKQPKSWLLNVLKKNTKLWAYGALPSLRLKAETWIFWGSMNKNRLIEFFHYIENWEASPWAWKKENLNEKCCLVLERVIYCCCLEVGVVVLKVSSIFIWWKSIKK